MSLKSTQQRISHNIATLEASDSLKDIITPVKTANFDQVMFTYKNNYYAVLRKSLSDTFPCVEKVLTGDVFFKIANSYIKAYPSQSPSLLVYGHQLPQHLATLTELSDLEFIVDLAQYELHRRSFLLYSKTIPNDVSPDIIGLWHSVMLKSA